MYLVCIRRENDYCHDFGSVCVYHEELNVGFTTQIWIFWLQYLTKKVVSSNPKYVLPETHL